MSRQNVLLEIQPLLEGHLEKSGYCLVDMRMFRDRQHQWVLEILADRAEGGITLDECVRLNRELGDAVEQSGLVQHGFVLDISSPGLDRPLTTKADFKRYIGRCVRVFLRESVEQKLEYCGDITAVTDENIVLNIGKKTVQIPLDKINKAKQVIS